MIANLIWLGYLAVVALVVAGTIFTFHLNITAGWAIIFVLSALIGFIGFEFNTQTPLQLGPLPFVFFVIALISLVVIITRLAT